MDSGLGITLLAVASPVAGVIGAWIAARVQQRRDAGSLALKIAQEAHNDVQQLRRWQRAVMRWWPRHERYDMAIQAELNRLDPTAEGRLPKAPQAPIWGSEDERTD